MLIYRRNSGFTLIEKICAGAVIAMIGSAAATKIVSAMEDAKVAAFVQQIDAMSAGITQFNVDTGLWPRHIPGHAEDRYHQLMVNNLDGANPINGWRGPYLEQELVHHLHESAHQDIFIAANNDPNWACDLDGDGAVDGQFIIYRADAVSDALAAKVSDRIDGDGDIISGPGDWRKAGKVRRYQGTDNSILEICLLPI